jgi:hypothetical protein
LLAIRGQAFLLSFDQLGAPFIMAMSGISSSSAMREAFASLCSLEDRALLAHISNESIEPGITVPRSGSDVDDFQQLRDLVEADAASYILYKLDDDSLCFTSYVPDAAPVRQKMLYCMPVFSRHVSS